MVLATDMAKHFEHVNKFINMLEKCIDEESNAEVSEIILNIETHFGSVRNLLESWTWPR